MSGQRKLAAILVADIVGYSRLTSIDEDNTVDRVRAIQKDVVDPNIAAGNGRLVKRTGDGALIEFRSVVDAVRCAIDIQRAMPERNAALPEDRRIAFRMGIHVGDVIEETDGDLMGDGVNIAARLEGLADPGAICLSEDAYRQVRSRLDLAVADLGENRLKNIAHPIRAFAVQVGAADEPRSTSKGPAAAQGAADKASIAVLPFTNMSGDADQEYFVDGMVEDIITALSRFDALFVIARNSTFVYKGRSVDIKSVGKDLGVRYVLEGSVRKSGDRIRITGQLIDTLTGAHLWADKFDGRLTDVFDLQDEVTAAVVGALEPTMRKAEIERVKRKPVEHWGAYDLYLQALPHIYAIRPDDNLKALDFLKRAIDLDPDYAPALAHAGWCLVQRATRPWPSYSDDDAALAVSFARRALATGGDDAIAVVLGGFALTMLREDYLTGLDAVRRAVALNPGSGFVNAMAGCAMIFGGDAKAGLELNERAMALCPKDPNYFSYLTVSAYGWLFRGEPEKALEMALRSQALNAEWDSVHWVLISAYTLLDRPDEARRIAAKLLEKHPEARTSDYGLLLPIRDSDMRRTVIDSLRAAGVPE